MAVTILPVSALLRLVIGIGIEQAGAPMLPNFAGEIKITLC